MYAQFFGLKQEPFSIAPDPRYLFMSERHREALAHLLYGVNGGGGFVLLSGEIGAGKTTVCRCFLEQIPKRCNVAYIFNPKLTVIELLKSICDEFCIPYPLHGGADATVKDFVDPLNEFLLKTHAVGQNSVLIIDEAQNLSAEVLEQLRLLTNLETNERKLLQIILIGQPELRELLARPELEQLAQRVTARFHLEALSEPETQQYVAHRLAVAGMTTAIPFDRKALQRIHRLSRGVPRRINLLCDRALLGAYATGKPVVTPQIVDKAAREVFDRRPHARSGRARPTRAAWMGAGALAGAAIVGATAWWALDGGARRAAGSGDASGAPSVAAGASGPARPAASGVAPSGALALAPADAPGPGPAGAPGPGPAGAASAAPSGATSTRAGGSGPAPGASSSAGATATAAVTGAAPGASGARGSESTTTAAVQRRAAAASAPVFLTPAELRTRFPSAERSERDAWRELAPLWQLSADTADPCAAAQRAQVQCYKSNGSNLALIRQLDRPGILTLTDDAERPVHALLTGLTDRGATLTINGASHTVSLLSLAAMWRGDFATYWRSPPGYAGEVVDGSNGPMAQWLAQQLTRLESGPEPAAPAASGASLRSRIQAFQVAHGLKPDGLAGPTTFMQLNRATGVEEPRLVGGKPISGR
jgi:general secretion pathway protein A